MYDKNKRVAIFNTSVGNLIDELKKLPKDAVIYICGDNQAFIHIEEDNSVVNIDTEDLDDVYDEDI